MAVRIYRRTRVASDGKTKQVGLTNKGASEKLEHFVAAFRSTFSAQKIGLFLQITNDADMKPRFIDIPVVNYVI